MNRVRKIIGYESYDVSWQNPPVGVCILDSGIAEHVDLKHRILKFKDFVNQKEDPYDDYGHGTHIAGICAGSGLGSAGKYRGVAPDCNLIVGKVLGNNGDGKIEDLLDGICWCIENRQKYNIRILNISVGLIHTVEEKRKNELMRLVEYAWDVGIVTVCAAGNNGPKQGSVTIPGSNPKVITVGSLENWGGEFRTSRYSGRGPTRECVVKPEIYAPGKDIISCSHQGGYTRKTGTSMSVPVVTGGIALLLQHYPFFTPLQVKLRLLERSKKMGREGEAEWRMFYLPYFLPVIKN